MINIITLLLIIVCFSDTSALRLTKPPSLGLSQNKSLPHSPIDIENPRCYWITTQPPFDSFNRYNCHVAAQIACHKLTSAFFFRSHVREQWIWIDELPGCAVGYYLPAKGPIPNLRRCEVSFIEIVEQCATNANVNAGSVNVAVLPDLTQDGRPILATDEMYLVAPQRLTP